MSRLAYCETFGADPATFWPRVPAVWFERWRSWSAAQNLRRARLTVESSAPGQAPARDRALYARLMTGKVDL